MSERLQPNGNPVRVGTITLRTPGLEGVATSYPANTPGMRAAEVSTEALETALRNESMASMETIEIAETREVPADPARLRSTSFGEPAIEVEVRDPGEDWGQVVLYTDEAGVTTWNFARDTQNRIDVSRGQATRTYVIRRRVSAPAGEVETRGLIGAVGKKLLKVLVFPMIDPVVGPIIGEAGDYFASRWEKAKRPYRIRTFTPDNYTSPDAPTIDGDAWLKLSEGPALLMVHGTFSRAHTAFATMPHDFVDKLWRDYGNRVVAFDHFTVSEDPHENVKWLVEHIPEGTKLDLDIICHSRGGLVSRVLAERQGEFSLGSRQLQIRRVVFVATPNAGTVLTDTKYLGDLVDSYTNLLNFFPSSGVIDVLEAMITVVKQLAVGVMNGLEGLQSMLPGGPYLTKLNAGPKLVTRYSALASNFEPKDGGLQDYAKDLLLDEIFRTDNDLVVPTAGVWDRNGSGQFPIKKKKRYVFGETDSIQHGGFFSNPLAREKILQWLSE